MPRLANVKIAGQYRTESFLRFLEQEKQNEDAKLAALAQPLTDELRRVNAECKAGWSQPIENAPHNQWNEDYLRSITPDLSLPVREQ